MNSKAKIALALSTIATLSLSTQTAVAVEPDITIEYEIPKGEPDMKCGDQYGTYYIYDKANSKKIQVIEKRAGSLLAIPLTISEINPKSNGVDFAAIYDIGISVERFKMSLDLQNNILTVFSEKTQKSYPIGCK